MASIEKEITNDVFHERETEEKHPTYESEMAFYHLIAEGREEEVLRRWRSKPRSDDSVRGVLSPDPVRNTMYHFIAMVTLVTRVCITAGLGQDVAYKTSDAYIRRGDKLHTPEEIRGLQEEMILHFTHAMAGVNQKAGMSRQIVQSMEYIDNHLHETITVADIARHVKLNETYLSKLFRKETGKTVSEYIRDKKIEEAGWLLRYTDKTSIEIATDLAFSSHSYFISVFKKVTGMTPREYRNKTYLEMKA